MVTAEGSGYLWVVTGWKGTGRFSRVLVVLPVVICGDFRGIYRCKNSLSCTLQMYSFYGLYIMIPKKHVSTKASHSFVFFFLLILTGGHYLH